MQIKVAPISKQCTIRVLNDVTTCYAYISSPKISLITLISNETNNCFQHQYIYASLSDFKTAVSPLQLAENRNAIKETMSLTV